MACPAFRPHFFGACPKKRCRAAKEKRFFYPGGSTIRVSATASVIFTHLRPTWGGAGACRGLGAGAPIRWEVVVGLFCHSTPFLWCLPKETVSSRQRKALLKPPRHLDGPTRLSHLGVSPNGTNWCVKLAYARWVNWPGKVSLTQSAGMLGLRVRGRGGWDRTATVVAPISAFLWGSTPFLCARAKKWGGIGSRGKRLLPRKTAHTHKPPTSTKPPAKVGRGTSRPPTCSAHANGGDTGVKKALFFGGSTPFLWASTKEMGSNRRTS